MNITKNKAQLIDITYALKSYNDMEDDTSNKAVDFKRGIISSIANHHTWIMKHIKRSVLERVLHSYFERLFENINDALYVTREGEDLPNLRYTNNRASGIDYKEAQQAIEKYIEVVEPFIRSLQCDAFEKMMDKEQGVKDGNEDEKKAPQG
jgi:hypothetical protein